MDFLAPLSLAAAGEHGLTLRATPGGEVVRQPAPATPPDSWREAAAALVAARPGTTIEQKAAGLVLHYRRAPAAGPGLRAGLEEIMGGTAGFEIMPASMAWELRPRGIDKGVAVRMLMATPALRGRTPIFIGDDVTDEDGIAAAIAMGGMGYRVPEAFGDAAGVRRWLATLAEAA